MTFLVNATYRPPNSSIEVWDKLETSIENAMTVNPRIFMLGDFNCDQMKKDNKLADMLDKFNMTQLITQPTHIKEHSSKCINATTSPDIVTRSGTSTQVFATTTI